MSLSWGMGEMGRLRAERCQDSRGGGAARRPGSRIRAPVSPQRRPAGHWRASLPALAAIAPEAPPPGRPLPPGSEG